MNTKKQVVCLIPIPHRQVGHSKLNEFELYEYSSGAIFNFNFIRGDLGLFEWHRQERHNWTPDSPAHFTFPLWHGTNNCGPARHLSAFSLYGSTWSFWGPTKSDRIRNVEQVWVTCYYTVACSRSAISRSFVITHLHLSPTPNVFIFLLLYCV